MDNYFSVLNAINVNGKTEKKNGLTYLSWAWAWAEVKKEFPEATYTVYERDAEYGPVNYFTDGRTCWVKTGVTINAIEHIEELPVMDFKNRSIPLESVNSMDVNKAIQRSLTKACARHGLGLYIYAGEDLPEDEANAKPARADAPTRQPSESREETPQEGEPTQFIPATQAQINTLRARLQPVQLAAMQQKFGENLERLSRDRAGEALSRIAQEAGR